MSPTRTHSPEETERLGEALAPAVRTGDVLSLEGPLGAGKTCFVTGLARGLACKARVRSPTFGLVHEYHGRVILAHLDLYRLDSAEAEGLGLEEIAERAALVVEWGEKLPRRWRDDALKVRFSVSESSPSERTVVAEASGERGAALLEAWRRSLAAGAAESAA
jgi:tRNA threonylcarbamoyladenosine biosynthesis protein TsaE